MVVTSSSAKRAAAVAFDDNNDGAPPLICQARDLQKSGVVSTGIGFLDHMLDQFPSHAQIGLSLQVPIEGGGEDEGPSGAHHHNKNRHAHTDQRVLLRKVGESVGTALRELQLQKMDPKQYASTFACPLDEALIKCIISWTNDDDGRLVSYKLAPYGKYPSPTGRTHIGKLETAAIECFWQGLAIKSGLVIQFRKIRGTNGHHVVESSFKAFSRALRNYLDGIDTTMTSAFLQSMYGPTSSNGKAGLDLNREGTVTRKTKETSIETILKLDGGADGVNVSTGVKTLDDFFTEFAASANCSLSITCQGDTWIDEHHTAEDVSIAVGQVLDQALGTKAGLNRMWMSTEKANEHTRVEVVMDLSNRPCFTHNLALDTSEEMVGDLSVEMFEHVLDSLVVNARMTVHIDEEKVESIADVYNNNDNSSSNNKDLMDTVTATARALGGAFKYCSMVDGRRAGATASSKGTLSV